MVCISLMISSVSALSEKQKDWFELMENEYLGKGIAVDQDGCWGAQCVDLVSQYVTYLFPDESLGKKAYSKSLGFGNARELYAISSSEYFDKIPYSQGIVPQTGDIGVWGKAGSGFYTGGHVAVIYYADRNNLSLIHQDGYQANTVVFREDGSFEQLSHYNGDFIGFLRPKLSKIKEHNPDMSDDFYNFSKDENNNVNIYMDNLEYNAIVDLNIMNPSENNSALDKLNRLELVVLVLRLTGNTENVENMSDEDLNRELDMVADVDQIADWGRAYVAYAMKAGMISGVTQTVEGKRVFDPAGTVSGAALATVIYRALNHQPASFEDVKNLYVEMVNNAEEGASSNIALLENKEVSRSDTAKIMFDFLKYAYYIDEEGDKVLSLKEHLINNNIIDEQRANRVLNK